MESGPGVRAEAQRDNMAAQAAAGHVGEEAWAIMNLDGEEHVSSGVHVLGFFVGHSGYNASNATITGARKTWIHLAFLD